MSIHIEQIRGLVIETGLEMLKSSLVVGTWGNISARIPEENVFAITPSGVDYETIEPIDVVIIDMDGNVVSGEKKPSIEWKLHLAIYKAREDIRAIVHTHSTYATAFAIAQKAYRDRQKILSRSQVGMCVSRTMFFLVLRSWGLRL